MEKRTARLLGFAVIVAACASAARAADEGYFVRKGTWLETIVASRDALSAREAKAEREYAGGKHAFQAVEVKVNGQDRPKPVRIRVAGLQRIYISCESDRQVFLTEFKQVDKHGDALAMAVSKARSLPLAKGGRARIQPRGGRRGDRQSALGSAVLMRAEVALDLAPKAETLEVTIGVTDGKSASLVVRFDRRSEGELARGHDAAAARIFALTEEAFDDPVSYRQRNLERQARIWDENWTTGDWADLAGRYARASGKLSARANELAKACKSFEDLKKVRDLFYVGSAEARLALAARTLALVQHAAPRPQYAAMLKRLQRRLEDARQGKASGEALYVQACRLRRAIILSHPLLDFDRLVINKRVGNLPGHMCDQYLGRHSRPGPGLVVLENWKEAPKATELLAGKLPAGGVIHPDLSYDGKRMLFAFAPQDVGNSKLRGYDIYEYSFDTGQVRQVTGTDRDPLVGRLDRRTVLIEDMDPVYLPDGGMAFISTRSQQYGRCHGSRYVPSYTLYRGELDGSGIRPLSFNEANEWAPAVLHDGSIIYCRWDYINRHDVRFQSLWLIHPDGTQTAHYYGNNSPAPCLTSQSQPIPGSHKTACTAAAHHGQTVGTLLMVDNFESQEGGEPLTWLTPELGFPESGVPKGITVTAMPLPEDVAGRGQAATPWPISEDLYLCSYRHGGQFAIYLIDTLGGREMIYTDRNTSCFDPIPLRPRPKPPTMPTPLPPGVADKTGVFVIQDVYQSTHPVARGTVKRLRINQIVSQTTRTAPPRSNALNEVVKKVLGTVPVNEDGSCAFEAPAETPLQFQMLDANGMAVMTMRSLVYLQPGERASCVGCHEPRTNAPVSTAGVMAPVIHQITPTVGPKSEGGMSFVRNVQPVLDRYCIGCHGLKDNPKGVDLTGTTDGGKKSRFNTAYDSLCRGGGVVKIAPRNGETIYSVPRDYFSPAGRLAKMLLAGHPDKDGRKRVQLDRDSFQRIVDWLDLNAQFYGDYSFNRIENQPPLPAGEKALRQAIEKRFGAELARQPYAALVNVANIGESRILMAPLATEAGGWGQITASAYKSADDPAWREMRKLAEASVTPLQYHDIHGTCGRGDRKGCRCGNCWVHEDIEARKKAPSPPATAARP